MCPDTTGDGRLGHTAGCPLRALEPPLHLGLLNDGSTRVAVTDRRQEGMDRPAGSGHQPTVGVGATIHPRENRAARMASCRTRPTRDVAMVITIGGSIQQTGRHAGKRYRTADAPTPLDPGRQRPPRRPLTNPERIVGSVLWRSIAPRPARSAACARAWPRRRRPRWCGRRTVWSAPRAGPC